MPRLALSPLVLPVLSLLAAACSNPQPPASHLKSSARLSPFFTSTCVTCHGANGDEGFAPQLSVVAYPDYVHSVRGGHPEKGVPPFDADEYPLSTLNADYTVITGRPAR